jgi:small subunit ribosomal protein S8
MYSDPISDMLTRIRNAGAAKHATVQMPASKMKLEVARVLKENGYIVDYERVDGMGFGDLRVTLKYHQDKHVVTGIQRASRPGQRRYVKAAEIPLVLGGYGTTVITTSQGLMTGRQARELGLGGELVCTVW